MRPAIYDTNTNTLMVVSVNNSYSWLLYKLYFWWVW
jgi:hypothetical protein